MSISRANLHWRLDGLDHHGESLVDLVSGTAPIPFNPYRVEKVHRLSLHLPDLRLVGTLHLWVTDQSGTTVARNSVNLEILKEIPAVEQDSNQWILNHNLEGELVEANDLSQSFDLPVEPESIQWMELRFEASSTIDGAPQTDHECSPSDATIAINGSIIETVTFPNAPADTRGALSYINGIPGKYGHLVRLPIDPGSLDLSSGKLNIEYRAQAEAENIGGITFYSQRAGRYPLSSQVRIKVN